MEKESNINKIKVDFKKNIDLLEDRTKDRILK